MDNMKIGFNGKLFLELIYKKALAEKKTKPEIRADLVKRLKVSKQALSLWASGMIPGIDNLFRLRDYFGLGTIEDLLQTGGDKGK